MSNKVIFGLLAVLAAYVVFSGSGSYEEYKDKTLEEFSTLEPHVRKEVVEDFLDINSLPDDVTEGFYACFSEMTFTKSKALKLDEIAGWCRTNYESGTLDEHINFDNLEKGFSPWDGSFRELENRIKQAMNDPASYEHVSTRYRLELNVTPPRAVITTEFRGKNAFGGIVKQQVSAIVDIQSGSIVEIVE